MAFLDIFEQDEEKTPRNRYSYQPLMDKLRSDGRTELLLKRRLLDLWDLLFSCNSIWVQALQISMGKISESWRIIQVFYFSDPIHENN